MSKLSDWVEANKDNPDDHGNVSHYQMNMIAGKQTLAMFLLQRI